MSTLRVWASLIAGPSTAPFSITFTNVYCEGEETIVIEGDLFHIEEDECSEVTDDKIQVLLNKAGLENEVALNQPVEDNDEEDNDDALVRKRRVFCEVIEELYLLLSRNIEKQTDTE